MMMRHIAFASLVLVAGGLGVVVAACSDDSSSFAFASAGGEGSSGASSGSSSSGATSTTSPPSPPDPPELLCERPPSGNLDAGGDGDAASSDMDAATADVVDAGVIGFNDCPTPPDDCIDSAWMVRYSLPRCLDQTCQWDVKVVACPRGCFRQIDGGDKCNE